MAVSIPTRKLDEDSGLFSQKWFGFLKPFSSFQEFSQIIKTNSNIWMIRTKIFLGDV